MSEEEKVASPAPDKINPYTSGSKMEEAFACIKEAKETFGNFQCSS
jgi:hypothetical protein